MDSDAAAITAVWRRSFAAALPRVRRAHTDAALTAWMRALVAERETWVALEHGSVVGMMVLGDEELEQLYLDPSARGRGIGEALLELAKRRRPSGLELWTFQVNTPARRFYARHGFTEVQYTDGSRNEEREPDVRMTFTPPAPGP